VDILLLISLTMVISFLIWQASVRGSFVGDTPEARGHVEALLLAADVLSWNDAELRARVQLGAEDPQRYFDEHGDDFGSVSQVWPFAVLCAELERDDFAVRAGAYDAPTLALCRRFDPMLARCMLAPFAWDALPSVGSGGSVERFLSELRDALAAQGLVLVHIDDGGVALRVSVQPPERFAQIADIVGPKGAYAFRWWRAWEVEQEISPGASPSPARTTSRATG
jgi:hypothetical protein